MTHLDIPRGIEQGETCVLMTENQRQGAWNPPLRRATANVVRGLYCRQGQKMASFRLEGRSSGECRTKALDEDIRALRVEFQRQNIMG